MNHVYAMVLLNKSDSITILVENLDELLTLRSLFRASSNLCHA